MSVLVFMRFFYFFVKRWFRNRSVFNHILSGGFNAPSTGAVSLHAPHHIVHRYRLAICMLSDHFSMINYGL